jgi:UDP-glucose 4-epimerase
MLNNCRTIILGKRSYLSQNLYTSLKNSRVLTIDEFVKSNFKNKLNLVINSFYPFNKLNNILSYKEFINFSHSKISKLLDKLKYSDNIQKIILSSSSSIYNKDILEINEHDLNRSLYSSSKILNEKLLINFCQKKKINFFIFRIFNIFGKNENFSIISKILNSKKNKKKIIINNLGESGRDFVYIDDIIKIYKFFLYKKNNSGIYDLGSGNVTRIKKLLKIIELEKELIIYSKKKIKEIPSIKANMSYLKKINLNHSFLSTSSFLKKEMRSR